MPLETSPTPTSPTTTTTTTTTTATTITSTTTTAPITTTTTADILPPPATLAHVYANIHANSSMLKPAGGERLVHTGTSVHDELHSQYSLIAVVVLTTLFLTITVSTAGLLLAFCKKKNTVFSLQKSEQDSQFEMDDMEKTDTESCQEDLSLPSTLSSTTSSHASAGKRRSATFPSLHAKLLDVEEAEGSGSRSGSSDSYSPYYSHHPHPNTDSPTAVTPLVCRQYAKPPRQGKHFPRTAGPSRPPIKRSITVAAIHHSDDVSDVTGDTGIRIRVEDMDSRDDLQGTSFGHLAFQLDKVEDSDSDDTSSCHGYSGYHDSDLDLDDSQNDQTVALLKC